MSREAAETSPGTGTATEAFQRRCCALVSTLSLDQLKNCQKYLESRRSGADHAQRSLCSPLVRGLRCAVLVAAIACAATCWPKFNSYLRAYPCLVPNNFVVMETTRPLSDCSACQLGRPIELFNPSREEFAPYAYSSIPILVHGAMDKWEAATSIDYNFITETYRHLGNVSGSGVEEGCQFLSFRSNLESLDDLLQNPDLYENHPDHKWYIGWSNCNDWVAERLRGLYQWPAFLPAEGELSAIDWIFMGTPGQGTALHIDNVQRPSWQAQVRGSKRWRLHPPPECEHVCSPFSVLVRQGQIFLLDTNQWYHGMEVVGNELSITIGSEYD